jgi:hypothetical protein
VEIRLIPNVKEHRRPSLSWIFLIGHRNIEDDHISLVAKFFYVPAFSASSSSNYKSFHFSKKDVLGVVK